MVQTLRPLITYPDPVRTARVVIRDVSVPASGSVTPKAMWSDPSATCGRYLARISSLPCCTTGCIPKIDRWIADAPFMQAPEAATSSSTTAASHTPRPPPPYSSGMAMPTQPPAAMAS